MIRVTRAPAPEDFEEKVGQPGRNFLDKCENPTSKQFSNHSYWLKIKGDLHEKYAGICAYSCHYIPKDTGSDTVEHFVPKSLEPNLAYVWDNYRLVCGKLNGRKGTHQDVLDPFCITDGLFILDFPSLLVKPGNNLDLAQRHGAICTIKRLKLNDDETCVSARYEYVKSYCHRHITFDYLNIKAPFIGYELVRQDLVEGIRDIMMFND